MATRNFHWSSVFDCVMFETDEADATKAIYTHEPWHFGPLVSENQNGTESYHHYDALGSTMLLTNDTGIITDTFLYDAWGNSVNRTGVTETRFQWVGRYGYQLDLARAGYQIRNRSYEPSIGRWTSVDPIWTIAMQGQYAYGADSPIMNVDPLGLRWELISGDTWKATEDGDTLDALAWLNSGENADWVCIWPTGDMGKWTNPPGPYQYPTANKCAQADVSNLKKEDGPDKSIMVKKVDQRPPSPGNHYLIALKTVGAIGSEWMSGNQAAMRLSEWSKQGETPIKRLLVGGHGIMNDDRICEFETGGNRCFRPRDVASVAVEPNNASNTLGHAKAKKGPPRCWFSRQSKVYGAACFSSTGWTAAWGTTFGHRGRVFGYSRQFAGFNNTGGPSDYIQFVGHPQTYNTRDKLLNAQWWE